MEKIVENVIGILQALIKVGSMGPVGWIAMGVTVLVLGGGSYFLYMCLRIKYNKQMYEEIKKQRQKDQANNILENQEIEDNWKKESGIDSKLDTLRKKKMKNRS